MTAVLLDISQVWPPLVTLTKHLASPVQLPHHELSRLVNHEALRSQPDTVFFHLSPLFLQTYSVWK